MVQKFNYDQWKKASLDLSKTKQSIEQMSKLYIIAHEKVKLIIRKCQTNLQYNPINDCQKQLQFIRVILQRLAERQNDQYLSKIDPHVLDKYEKNFFDLIQLLRLALVTYDSRQKVDLQGLRSISQNKHLKKDQYSLRSQLQKSQNRMIRTKSGHRISKQNNQTKIKQLKQQIKNQFQAYQQLIPQKNNIQFIEPTKYEQQFKAKRLKLEQTINSHIQKQGFTLNFKKKYDKLDEYLQERKQFSDLLFSQKYYDQMIQMGRTRKNQPKISQRKDPDLNKIFPQFNIKTKYLKNNVKDNILQVIFNVKKQLLQQFHQLNIAKMKQVNQGGLIKIKKTKKPQVVRPQTSIKNQQVNNQVRFRSTNRLIQKRRHSLINLRKGVKIQQKLLMLDQQNKKLQDKAFQMLNLNKMPYYKK